MILLRGIFLIFWIFRTRRFWREYNGELLQYLDSEAKNVVFGTIKRRPYCVYSAAIAYYLHYVCKADNQEVEKVHILRVISSILAVAIFDDCFMDGASQSMNMDEAVRLFRDKQKTLQVGGIKSAELRAVVYLLNWVELSLGYEPVTIDVINKCYSEMILLAYLDDSEKSNEQVRIDLGKSWGQLLLYLMGYDQKYFDIFTTSFGSFALLDDLADIAIDVNRKNTSVIEYITRKGYNPDKLSGVIFSGVIAHYWRKYISINSLDLKADLNDRYLDMVNLLYFGYMVKMLGKYISRFRSIWISAAILVMAVFYFTGINAVIPCINNSCNKCA